jgi:hypothetical protein
MNILDAKIINTKYGLETYLDIVGNIEVKEIRYPTKKDSLYEIKLGVEYFLLKERKYYDRAKNYFWITMSKDFHSISLKETYTESLFGVKSETERESTKKLVIDWLIKTHAFKHVIGEWIEKKKTENLQTEEEINSVIEIIKFLETLLQINVESIEVKACPA